MNLEIQRRVLSYGLDDSASVGPRVIDSIGWNALLEWAVSQRVVGLLNAGASTIARLDERQREELTEQFRAAMQTCLLVESAVAAISNLLERAGVDWRLLKGVATSRLLYPDAGWRIFSDVDILVRPEDLDRSLDALLPITAVGAPVLPGRVRTRAWQEWQITDTRGAGIDVHHAVAGSLVTSRLPVDLFFDRPLSVSVGGRRVLTPDLAVSFVHSVMHLTTGGRRLSTVPDLVRLARLIDPDDERVSELLSARTTRALFIWGLNEAANWVDLPEAWNAHRSEHAPGRLQASGIGWVQQSSVRMSLANTFLGKYRLRRLGETLWPSQEFLEFEGVSRLGNYRRLMRKGLQSIDGSPAP